MIKTMNIEQGRLFTVGDIHGCFKELDAALDAVGFDTEKDTLIAVGDLVDRGPQSELAVLYLQQPWFHSVMGNHETMCHPAFAGSYWHIQNGGSWVDDLDEKHKQLKPLLELPVMIEAHYNGKKYGFVHASLNGILKWDFAKEYCNNLNPFDEHPFLWDRTEVYGAKDPNVSDEEFIVEGIDHVYFGHTPLKEPLTRGNCSWIDTGCFATGKLTLWELG